MLPLPFFPPLRPSPPLICLHCTTLPVLVSSLPPRPSPQACSPPNPLLCPSPPPPFSLPTFPLTPLHSPPHLPLNPSPLSSPPSPLTRLHSPPDLFPPPPLPPPPQLMNANGIVALPVAAPPGKWLGVGGRGESYEVASMADVAMHLVREAARPAAL
ncbi:unnamed protein product [Closterium sp. Naga37s-1]|nr:unnamed protein product [Closterium sp. Naga37s-1]